MTPRTHSLVFVAAVMLVTIATGCPDRQLTSIPIHGVGTDRHTIPISINRDLDVLFVIDNSGSMKDEQAALQRNFHRFMSVLEGIDGGLPNVHIGVVSSNVGTGLSNIDKCHGDGDHGRLQNVARIPGCQPQRGFFLSDEALPDGSRERNYDGDLADAFACIAGLGTDGCGLEQHLESMKRALDGSNLENAGFLRPDAYLAVVFLADEDDCSAQDSALYAMDHPDFRCAQYGVLCDGHVITEETRAYELCQSYESSPYLLPTGYYADFLRSIKPDPTKIVVAGIVGTAQGLRVVTGDNGPEVDKDCATDAAGSGTEPGIRLRTFFNQFPQHSTSVSICNEDLSDALTEIAGLVKDAVGEPCLGPSVDVADLLPAPGLQLACQVSDIRFVATDRQVESVLPRCAISETTGEEVPLRAVLPCWWAEIAPGTCGDDTSGVILKVERAAAPASDTSVVATCTTR